MNKIGQLKEFIDKMRCILRIHKWKPVNPDIPDYHDNAGFRVPHSKSKYYYVSQWRYCPNCGRIESLIKYGYKIVTVNYIDEPERENLHYKPKKGILHFKGV